MSKTFVLHISWVDVFFLLSALVSFNLWRRIRYFFSLDFKPWLDMDRRNNKNNMKKIEPKPLKSVSFSSSLEMNYLRSVYIFWQSLIYTKEERKIDIKIPENGRRTTFSPPSYQLSSIYSKRWFLFLLFHFFEEIIEISLFVVISNYQQ